MSNLKFLLFIDCSADSKQLDPTYSLSKIPFMVNTVLLVSLVRKSRKLDCAKYGGITGVYSDNLP